MRRLHVFALLSITLSAAACAAPEQAPGADDPLGDEAADFTSTKCSRDAYARGLAEYKLAVDHAKRFLRRDACDDATTFDIANELGRSVAACRAFEDVIATSKWAAPVREVLKDNLALAVVTGKLSVAGGAGKPAWTGLRETLASGAVVYGPAPGVYGNMSKIRFGQGGRATLSRLELATDPQSDAAPTWKDSPATYTIGAPRPDGSIEITITPVGAKGTSYLLRESRNEAPFDGAPGFVLTPSGAGEHEAFTSFPSECEA